MYIDLVVPVDAQLHVLIVKQSGVHGTHCQLHMCTLSLIPPNETIVFVDVMEEHWSQIKEIVAETVG